MVGNKARAYYDQQAKERQKRKPAESVVESLPEQKHSTARDAAGKAVGVSGKLVDHAHTVSEKGVPELTQAVKAWWAVPLRVTGDVTLL